VRGLNFGHHFYNLLFNEFDNLIVYKPFKSSIGWWAKIGALADTRAIWQPRSSKYIGLGVENRLHFYNDLTGAKLRQLEQALQETVVQKRNKTLAYLNLAHGCDVPILETVSTHWPGNCRVRLDARGEKWRIRILSKSEEEEWRIEEDDDGEVPPLFEPEQVVCAARSSQRISLDDCYREWTQVFRRFGIRPEGSAFGDFLGLQTRIY
jgi:hypothetical protein